MGLAIGGVIGWVYGYVGRSAFSFTVKREIDLADFYKITVIAAGAYFLKTHFERRTTNLKLEKELLIGRLQVAIGLLKDARAAFMDAYDRGDLAPEQRGAIVRAVRSLSVSTSGVERMMKHCDVQVASIKLEELSSQYIRYKEAVSGTSGRFTEFDSSKERLAFQALYETLELLILDINRG